MLNEHDSNCRPRAIFWYSGCYRGGEGAAGILSWEFFVFKEGGGVPAQNYIQDFGSVVCTIRFFPWRTDTVPYFSGGCVEHKVRSMVWTIGVFSSNAMSTSLALNARCGRVRVGGQESRVAVPWLE